MIALNGKLTDILKYLSLLRTSLSFFFGIPLVVVRPKGGLSFGAGMGIFVIFIYYVFIKLGMSIGYSGITSPIVAAWMGNVLFFIGGILLLVFVRK